MRNVPAVLATALCLSSASATTSAADLTPLHQVLVTSISGSESQRSGLFLITSNVGLQGCEAGYWLPASAPQYAAQFTAVHVALGRQIRISIVADKDQLLAGVEGRYCRIVDFR